MITCALEQKVQNRLRKNNCICKFVENGLVHVLLNTLICVKRVQTLLSYVKRQLLNSWECKS